MWLSLAEEDRKQNQSSSNIFKEAEWTNEEGVGAVNHVQCGSGLDCLIQQRQTLRVFQFQVPPYLPMPTSHDLLHLHTLSIS